MLRETHFLVHYKVGWFRWAYAAMNSETGSVTPIAKVRGFTEANARKALIEAFNKLADDTPSETIDVAGVKPFKIRFKMTETGIQTRIVSE